MKKQILQQKLIKSLLNSDFLFLEKKASKRQLNSRYINNSSSAINKQNLICLDIFEVVKDLKQLIRMIYFLQKYSKTKKELHFFINEEKNYPEFLIENFLKIEPVKQAFSFDINSHSTNSRKISKKSINLGLLMDNLLLNDNDKNFFKNQFNKNIFLFLTINSEIEANLIGYKIYNNINDYKKTLFFLSFLRQILITYAISKKI